MVNLQQALSQAKQSLVNSDSAQLDAELLLAHVLKKSRSYLRAFSEHELSATEQASFFSLIDRRQQGEPVAYILGEKEFWSLPLQVNADVLIPRAETECLVQAMLAWLPETEISVADLGTGSGAIALALAHERPVWNITATDISAESLRIARDNAQQLNLKQVCFLQSNWCAELQGQSFNAIVSNPPYIAQDDPALEMAVEKYQPSLALFAEDNGLAAYKIIAKQAWPLLKDTGCLFLEHGYQQQTTVCDILLAQGYEILECGNDLANVPRFVVAQKSPK